LFSISRSGYYKKLVAEKDNQQLEEGVLRLVKKHRKRMGRLGTIKLYDKIRDDLLDHRIKCGRDKLFDILRSNNMLVKKKRNYTRTTNSYHRFLKYKNLIQGLIIGCPEQVWVSDITYIKTNEGYLYLFLITDAYSKKIMGYEISENMKVSSGLKALRMAIKGRIYPGQSLIHHSDRGLQYCHPDYTKELENNSIQVSMTTKYDPYENAIAERVNGILKSEFDLGYINANHANAKKEIHKSIVTYNTFRPHFSCGLLTPEKAHKYGTYELKKWHKKYKIKSINELENRVSSPKNIA
jgi:transposase InsO family protein